MKQQNAATFGNSSNRPNLLIIIEPVGSESCDEYIMAHFEASSLLLNPFGQDRQQSQLTISQYGGNTQQTLWIKIISDEKHRNKSHKNKDLRKPNFRNFIFLVLYKLLLIAQFGVWFIPILGFIANLKYDQIKLTSDFETIKVLVKRQDTTQFRCLVLRYKNVQRKVGFKVSRKSVDACMMPMLSTLSDIAKCRFGKNNC